MRYYETLEARRMMDADGGDHDDYPIAEFASIDGAVAVSAPTAPMAAPVPLTAIPVLNSSFQAKKQLYLDFNGHFDAQWGYYQNVRTPVFSLDGDLTTFNDAEIAAIKEIYARVSEDYSGFDINVTTVEPPSFADKVGMRVAIGGNGSWYGNAGGVAFRNSYFDPSLVNTVHVFPGMLANNAKYIAEAASHEAGHSFGLAHQSKYSTTGALVSAYDYGDSQWAPIMGVGYYSARTTWQNGTTVASYVKQDDLAILSNALVYKYDDHGDTPSTARKLHVYYGAVWESGTIEKMSDQDHFSFVAGTGKVTLNVSVALVGANLDTRIELWNAAGVMVASAAPTDSLGASITANLTQGSYRLVVMSAGRYGDLGRYKIEGTIVMPTIQAAPVAAIPTAPTVPATIAVAPIPAQQHRAVDAYFATEIDGYDVGLGRSQSAAVLSWLDEVDSYFNREWGIA